MKAELRIDGVMNDDERIVLGVFSNIAITAYPEPISFRRLLQHCQKNDLSIDRHNAACAIHSLIARGFLETSKDPFTQSIRFMLTPEGSGAWSRAYQRGEMPPPDALSEEASATKEAPLQSDPVTTFEAEIIPIPEQGTDQTETVPLPASPPDPLEQEPTTPRQANPYDPFDQ